MFKIRLSFLQAIIAVGHLVDGHERAEAALWFLMRLIRATELEKRVLIDAIMGVEENNNDDQKS